MPYPLGHRDVTYKNAASTRDRTGDLQIFSLTLSQLSYRGIKIFNVYRIRESNPCLPGESQLS